MERRMIEYKPPSSYYSLHYKASGGLHNLARLGQSLITRALFHTTQTQLQDYIQARHLRLITCLRLTSRVRREDQSTRKSEGNRVSQHRRIGSWCHATQPSFGPSLLAARVQVRCHRHYASLLSWSRRRLLNVAHGA